MILSLPLELLFQIHQHTYSLTQAPVREEASALVSSHSHPYFLFKKGEKHKEKVSKKQNKKLKSKQTKTPNLPLLFKLVPKACLLLLGVIYASNIKATCSKATQQYKGEAVINYV